MGRGAGMLDSFDASGVRRLPPLTSLQRRFNELAETAGLSITGRIDPSFIDRHRDRPWGPAAAESCRGRGSLVVTGAEAERPHE